jgi:hypothetical protein
MRNALTYASMANRSVTITLMLLSSLLTRFGHIPKLLIREVTCVLMTDRCQRHSTLSAAATRFCPSSCVAKGHLPRIANST